MQLYHNDRVKTFIRSGCIISFSDMSTFGMKEDTTIVLDIANEKTSKISLLDGIIWNNLKSIVKDGSMEIEMGHAIAGARGTTFICEERDGVSIVKVFEGTVEVTAKATGKSVMVSGGEMLSTDSTGKGKLTMFDMEAELANWEPYVQQVTAGAMEEAARKSGGFPIGIVVVAVVLLVAGVAATVEPTYVASLQAERSPQFCPNCSNPLGENSKFCGKCGQRLS